MDSITARGASVMVANTSGIWTRDEIGPGDVPPSNAFTDL
jgi:hypothetical protein